MVRTNEEKCPSCGGYLRYYDKVKRMVRIEGGCKRYIKIRRMKCTSCRKLHRELPNHVLPYKQYTYEIIMGVLNGHITSDILGYEDYPCEMTMFRWSRKIHVVL